MRLSCFVALTLTLFGPAGPADGARPTKVAKRGEAPQVGKVQLPFTEPSPMSTLDQLGTRSATSSMGTYGRSGRAYEVDGEAMNVYVPASYKGDRAFGLFVFVSPTDAILPEQWRRVIDRQRLIWVSVENTGNRREMIPRVGLQLDAVHNLTQRYNIDPQRIYISGFSGGAMTSEILIRSYPDVFSGAFLMSGGSFYGRYGDLEEMSPTMSWHGTDLPIEEARKVMRLVLLHGTKDAYAAGMKPDYESFMLDDFEHVTYLRIEGMGHTIPSAGWLAKGLVALDRSKNVERPRTITPTTGSTKRTFNSLKRKLPAHDPEKQAQRVLNSGKSYFDNALFDGAVVAAQRVLDEYAETPAAAEAKLLLDRIEFIKPVAVPYGQSMRTPALSALFFGRGAVNKNRHDAARLYLQRVQTLSPDSPESAEAKAWIQWMDRNASAAATKPSKPGNLAVILFQSGLSYSSANMPDAARAAYERVVREFPKTPAATEARKLLAKKGNKEDAASNKPPPQF